MDEKMTMWRNWFEGINAAPDDQRLAWYDAVMRFCFLGEEPPPAQPGDQLSLVRWQAVCNVRGSVAASRRQRANGSKPKAKRKPKASQTQAKPKPPRRKSETTPKQIEVEIEKEVEIEDEVCVSARARVIDRMRGMLPQIVSKLGAPTDFARTFAAAMDQLDWRARDRGGRMFDVTPSNLTSVMRGWWLIESKNESLEKKFPPRASTPSEHCDGNGHAMTLDAIPDAPAAEVP